MPVFYHTLIILMGCEETQKLNIQPAINLLGHSFQHALTNCSYGTQFFLTVEYTFVMPEFHH